MAGRPGARTAGRSWWVPRRSQSAAPLPRVVRSWLVLSAGGLPVVWVVWVVAVLAGAVQRPGGEPAAVMTLKAQRADHRSVTKIPPQVVTHDIGDIPRWSPGQGRLRCLGAVSIAAQLRPSLLGSLQDGCSAN